MSRIFRDSSVLNQFGSPSINSNILANRPAFGQVGRLFVDTTNNVIYRDTGTSWVLIGGSGGSQNLQQVTTIGNTTDQGINVLSNSGLYVTSDGNISNRPTTYPFALYAVGFNVLKSTYNVNDANINVAAILQSNINVNVTSTKNTFFNANFSNLDLNIPTGSTLTLGLSANNGALLALNSFSGSGGGSISNDQIGSNGFRALSPLISKTNYTSLTNNITIDYYAGINIYGAEGITSTGKLSIGQYYSLLINPSDYFANSPTITGNRWGIYQAGANDVNYFASDLLVGKTTKAGIGRTIELFNNGDVQFRIQNNITGSGSADGAILFIDGAGRFGVYNYENTDLLFGTNNAVKATLYNTGNFGIGTITDSGDMLQINGNTLTNSLSINGNLQSGFMLDVHGDTVLRGSTYNIGALFVNNPGTALYITTLTNSGLHSPSANYLPINVNGITYYLQLLN